jgi:hypothetical protein
MRKISFRQLLENIDSSEKDSEHIDTKAMKAIRSGMAIGESFWDQFIQVCNNTEALAELLGVRSEQVSGWASTIKHNLERVHKADTHGEGEEEVKTKVVDTGSNLGGISMNNQL